MKKVVCTLYLVISFARLMAQGEEARKAHFNIRKNVALEGYDPVSYFDRKPAEGKEEFHLLYRGIHYHFASQANRDRFKSDPEKYEPAFGGWCAYAMGATGEKVKVDPETYKIVDGKLYLFYHFWGNNTLDDWNKNERQLMMKADQNWKKFLR